jgi:hypothetical protein
MGIGTKPEIIRLAEERGESADDVRRDAIALLSKMSGSEGGR